MTPLHGIWDMGKLSPIVPTECNKNFSLEMLFSSWRGKQVVRMVMWGFGECGIQITFVDDVMV